MPRAASPAPSRAIPPPELRATLRDEFGFQRLRYGQDEVMRAVLAGRDTLAVMPTGAGKSLCYQLPGLQLPGTTVVVSPLISLMKDQVDKLLALGRRAHRLDSTAGAAAERAAFEELAAGEVEFLFVTPERLARDELIARLCEVPLDFVVIDEAHCVSEWGHDFRPDYLELGRALDRLGRPPFLALTATAGDEVVADLREHLRSPDLEVVDTGVYRPNLRLEVMPAEGDEAKRAQVLAALEAAGGAAIVYLATVRRCELLAEALQELGWTTGAYHGRLGRAERHEVQERFMAGELRVVVATRAFGMGIDKQDIRLILHHDLPSSPDSYYQEAGRAGRDGEPARCLLLYDPDDLTVQRRLLASGLPRPEDVRHVWRALAGGARDLAGVAEAAGIGRRRAQTALRGLVRLGLAERNGDLHRAGLGELPETVIDQVAEEYGARREANEQRLARIEQYAQTALCRWAHLAAALQGDEDDGGSWWCGHCDNCLRHENGVRLGRRLEAAEPEVEPVRAALRGGPGAALGEGAAVSVPLYGEGEVERVDALAVTVRFRDGSLRRVGRPAPNGGSVEAPDVPGRDPKPRRRLELRDLDDVFQHELSKAYDGEHRVAEALEELAGVADDPELQKILRQQLEQTRGHLERLEGMFERRGETPRRRRSRGMEAVVRETRRIANATGVESALDAARLAGARRLARCGIAVHGALRSLAAALGRNEEAVQIGKIADQQAQTDERLAQLAEQRVLPRAAETAG